LEVIWIRSVEMPETEIGGSRRGAAINTSNKERYRAPPSHGVPATME
jgi:hypothetical protein